ncbi:hypothetical protein PVAP13_5KG548807 [Panicum virgatum]|uniref:Uncharacterized protein n=1 Tax=Panicum virgatum TaxID=38727 RepID=A0A8T0SF10_PANVG|nr:hypothetical protein PVAP13_5KG548807 [Panicum virgatum]
MPTLGAAAGDQRSAGAVRAPLTEPVSLVKKARWIKLLPHPSSPPPPPSPNGSSPATVARCPSPPLPSLPPSLAPRNPAPGVEAVRRWPTLASLSPASRVEVARGCRPGPDLRMDGPGAHGSKGGGELRPHRMHSRAAAAAASLNIDFSKHMENVVPILGASMLGPPPLPPRYRSSWLLLPSRATFSNNVADPGKHPPSSLHNLL